MRRSCTPPAQCRRPKKVGQNQAIGHSRGGLTTPLALSLTPRHAADITQAQPLLQQIEPDALIADKGYDCDALVENLEIRGIAPVIPPKATRKHQRTTDFALNRQRNLVERFFCTLHHFRPVATRTDKLANTFLAGVLLVCVLMWLN
jgi:transposase